MQGTILLNQSENLHQVEDEEKSRFLRNLLDQMFENTNVVEQIAEIWENDILLPFQKIKIRELLTTYSIQVIDDFDGSLKVFVEGELVGEWLKCKYKLKRDLSRLDRRKQLYLEMSVNCWTAFDAKEIQET